MMRIGWDSSSDMDSSDDDTLEFIRARQKEDSSITSSSISSTTNSGGYLNGSLTKTSTTNDSCYTDPLEPMEELYSYSESSDDEDIPISHYMKDSPITVSSESPGKPRNSTQESHITINSDKTDENNKHVDDSFCEDLPLKEYVRNSDGLNKLQRDSRKTFETTLHEDNNDVACLDTSLNENLPLKAMVDPNGSFMDDIPLSSFTSDKQQAVTVELVKNEKSRASLNERINENLPLRALTDPNGSFLDDVPLCNFKENSKTEQKEMVNSLNVKEPNLDGDNHMNKKQKSMFDYYDGLPLSLIRANKTSSNRTPLTSVNTNIPAKKTKVSKPKKTTPPKPHTVNKNAPLSVVWVAEDDLPLCTFLGSTKRRKYVCENSVAQNLLCSVALERINETDLQANMDSE